MNEKKKVLFVTKNRSYFTQPVIQALESLGYAIKVFDYYSPSFLSQIMGVVMSAKAFKKTKRKVLDNTINQALLRVSNDFKPDYLLVIKGETIAPSTIRRIKHSGVITINWFPDWHIAWQWVKRLAPSYSIFINSCHDTHKKLEKFGIKNYYLPFAAQPDILKDHKPKKFNIVFVGQHSNRRELYFATIRDLGLHIWGYQGWQKSRLKDIASSPTTIEQAHNIFRRSKIVVNILGGTDKFQPAAVNVRTFETLAVGTFLLVKYHPILKKHFNIGKELVTFTNPGDLRKKATYYLNHDTEREKIAQAGYNRVRTDHTFTIRLKQLFEIVNTHVKT